MPAKSLSRYDQARADFEFLEGIEQLEDQVELDSMRLEIMENPTKAMAASMYEAGIRLWFGEHRAIADADPEIIEIGERHGATLNAGQK